MYSATTHNSRGKSNILSKNMVEAINKEADKENSLKIVLAKDFN